MLDPESGRSKRHVQREMGDAESHQLSSEAELLSLSWKGHRSSRKIKTNLSVGKRSNVSHSKSTVKASE